MYLICQRMHAAGFATMHRCRLAGFIGPVPQPLSIRCSVVNMIIVNAPQVCQAAIQRFVFPKCFITRLAATPVTAPVTRPAIISTAI